MDEFLVSTETLAIAKYSALLRDRTTCHDQILNARLSRANGSGDGSDELRSSYLALCSECPNDPHEPQSRFMVCDWHSRARSGRVNICNQEAVLDLKPATARFPGAPVRPVSVNKWF